MKLKVNDNNPTFTSEQKLELFYCLDALDVFNELNTSRASIRIFVPFKFPKQDILQALEDAILFPCVLQEELKHLNH